MNLTRLPETLPQAKVPKQTITFMKMNLTQRSISDFCVQLEGLFKRPGSMCLISREFHHNATVV